MILCPLVNCIPCLPHIHSSTAFSTPDPHTLNLMFCGLLFCHSGWVPLLLKPYRPHRRFYILCIRPRSPAFPVQSAPVLSFREPVSLLSFCPSYNPRPVGVWGAKRPVEGGGAIRPPPKISRTTQRSDKRQTTLDSPGRELSEACIFFFKSRSRVRSN